MLTFANADILAEYLRRAEHAHKVSGAPDAGWSDWYAEFIATDFLPIWDKIPKGNDVFLPGDVAPTEIK